MQQTGTAETLNSKSFVIFNSSLNVPPQQLVGITLTCC